MFSSRCTTEDVPVIEVDAELDGAAQNLKGVAAISRPAPNALSGNTHRAKAEAVDRKIATQPENGIGAWLSYRWRIRRKDHVSRHPQLA